MSLYLCPFRNLDDAIGSDYNQVDQVGYAHVQNPIQTRLNQLINPSSRSQLPNLHPTHYNGFFSP